MATFQFRTSVLDMTTGSVCAGIDELSALPDNPSVAMAFAHEYTHYVQLISSVFGMRVLGELLDFGVGVALALAGEVPFEGGEVADGAFDILELLRKQETGAARREDGVAACADSIVSDLETLFVPASLAFEGEERPWQVVRYPLLYQTRQEPFYGYVTPSQHFRAFSPGLLAEGMARRTDQWLRLNHQFDVEWERNDEGSEHYDGIRHLLAHRRYCDSVTESNIEELTFILCHLALATNIPDQSTYLMLKQLEHGFDDIAPNAIAIVWRDLLSNEGLLSRKHFQDVYDYIAGQGKSLHAMKTDQLRPILDYLTVVRQSTEIVIDRPDAFATPSMQWPTFIDRVREFRLPKVKALEDCYPNELWGIRCGTPVSELLTEIDRVIFTAPQPI